MTTSRQWLAHELENYSTTFGEEREFASLFLQLLKHPRAYYRDHLPGHITASCLILNKERSKVFMIRHAKLKKWLQPGGHADGEEDVLAVARKEAFEETGLMNITLLTSSLFDIDIHPIPARPDFQEHTHYDVRFAFEADERQRITPNHESIEIGWKSVGDLESLLRPDSSIQRMIAKSLLL